MFSIGEFSTITGLSIKTLRFYHEQGLLTPTFVDPHSGYRYYDHSRVEKARIIVQLRALDFSLQQISELLASSDEEVDILEFLEKQRTVALRKLQQYRGILSSLDKIIHQEREARAVMQNATFTVEEKELNPQLIAGVRMKGSYRESGKGFSRIGKNLGRYIAGKCLLLHYDTEFKESDADFEACMPVRKCKAAADISVRELPGGHCVSLLHKGPYDQIGRSYETLLTYIKQKGYEIVMPTREVYLKGPGMIFRGNPRNYLTEIQILVQAPK
jgi:DNA-binding transcriptional MerR regulator/effector-binding domain-containing protein